MKKATSSRQTFKITPIHIMLDLNTSPKPVLFTYSMLAIPDLPKVSSYKYPYFTNSLKYDESYIQNLTLEYKMKFFFDKKEFSNIVNLMLASSNNDYIDYKQNLDELKKVKGDPDKTKEIFSRQSQQEVENEQYNIMMMLKHLFPIYPKFNDYLKRSDYELTGTIQSNIFKVNINDTIDSVNYFGWMDLVGAIAKERGACYLSIDSKPAIVKSVVWENDIITHPVYSEFIKVYNLKMNDIENNIFDVAKKKEESESGFVTKIEKYMMKELDVSLEGKLSKPKGEENILKFYFDDVDNTKKPINEATGVHRGGVDAKKLTIDTNNNVQNAANMIQYGLNPIYEKIYNKWFDNMDVSKTVSSKSGEIKTSAQAIMKEMQIFLEAVLDYRETPAMKQRQALIATHINLVKILDENYAMKSRIGILFDFGDGERAMKDLFLAAIDLKTMDRIQNFVDNKELFNMDTKIDDEMPKIESEKRIISRIKNTYPQYAELSRALVDTLKSVLPPDRKTSNQYLYELLSKTKTGTWGKNASENKKVIEEIYNRFIQKSNIDISVDVGPFLYTGVDAVISKKDTTEGDTKEQTNEIYVKIDVIGKKEYEMGKNCMVKDNELKNHLQYLLQNNFPYTLPNPNRDYIMIDVDGPVDVVDGKDSKDTSTQVKSSVDSTKKKKRVGGGRGGNRKTKRVGYQKRTITRAKTRRIYS